MEQTELSQVEVTAEVLRLIRANDNHTAQNLWKLIKQHLPDVPEEMLTKAISYIYERAEAE